MMIKYQVFIGFTDKYVYSFEKIDADNNFTMKYEKFLFVGAGVFFVS